MVQEVQNLNKKIESINVQRARAEATVDMLKKQLSQEVEEYKKNYGVDLSDKSFAKLSGKVKAELSKVTEEIKAEFKLKEKVVIAIEEGRYNDAYKLLGVDVEEVTEVEEVIEVEEEVVELDGLGVSEVDIEIEGIDLDEVSIEDTSDDIVVPVVEESEGIAIPDNTSKVKGESALKAVETMEIKVEDDDDDVPSLDDVDWGFGSILSGTQFDTN